MRGNKESLETGVSCVQECPGRGPATSSAALNCGLGCPAGQPKSQLSPYPLLGGISDPEGVNTSNEGVCGQTSCSDAQAVSLGLPESPWWPVSGPQLLREGGRWLQAERELGPELQYLARGPGELA